MTEPVLRADARRNRERVLQAADQAFARSGFGVPLDVIAAAAGVGPGTVYRHFPTKEALFEAVVRGRVTDLVDFTRTLATGPEPGDAFFALLARLGVEATHKRDLSEAIGVPGPLLAELHEAVGVLLAKAQAAGAVRHDIGPAELMALLKGLVVTVQSSPDPDLARRVLAVLGDGLRPARPAAETAQPTG